METSQLRILRMLSEEAQQNISIISRHHASDISQFQIKLHTKTGMIYQMYSVNDESSRYHVIDEREHVKPCL